MGLLSRFTAAPKEAEPSIPSTEETSRTEQPIEKNASPNDGTPPTTHESSTAPSDTVVDGGEERTSIGAERKDTIPSQSEKDHTSSGVATPANATIEKEGSGWNNGEQGGTQGTSNGPEQTALDTRAQEAPSDEKTNNAGTLAKVTTTSTEASVEGPEDESKYPTGLPLILLTVGLCLGTFVVAIDNTIIATAIPRITTVFNSLDDIGWYGSAYLLTTASLQPSLGKVYSFFNVKWTYIMSVFIFEVGSVICGAAVTSEMLIIGRAIAGIGGSGLFSGAMTIVAYSVPLRKRSIYIASVSSMFGIASIVGPILGGAFTDRVSWRWCFYINLPIGALCIATVFVFFKNPVRKESKLTTMGKILELDILGALFLIAAVICLLLALQWGGSTYPWNDSKVYGCFIGFGLLIIVFIYIQFKRGDRATLPPRILLKQRTVLASAVFSFFLSLSIYILVFCKSDLSSTFLPGVGIMLVYIRTNLESDLPIWFQAVRNTTAEQSGIRTIPFLVSNILAAIPVGFLVMKLGYYTPFIWFGSALFPIGAGLLYTLKVNSGANAWIGYQIFAGLSVGICIQLPFIAVQVVLKSKDMPVGNAVCVFFNTLGKFHL